MVHLQQLDQSHAYPNPAQPAAGGLATTTWAARTN